MTNGTTTLNSDLSSGLTPGKSAAGRAEEYALTSSSSALTRPESENTASNQRSTPWPPEEGFKTARECDCPPWVMRCAHFVDRIIVLADGRERTPHYACIGPCYAFGVMEVAGFKKCSKCGQAIGVTQNVDGVKDGYHSEADALAAFYAAEEALLAEGREA